VNWPLVGRDAELGAVFQRLDHDPAAAIVVAGAAGVGKSRLVREIAGRADERGWSTTFLVGMRAAASIPFGAVAPLIDELAEDVSPVDMLAKAKRALTAGGRGSTQLLAVDDAQRLDSGTATLVHQVVVDRLCRAVLTVRSGEPAPDAIESLWTSGLVERRELQGLSRVQTGELLEATLGGPVDGSTQHRLWQASGGNVLYLRELVLGASASGALREEGGIWRLHGSAVIPARLVELVRQRLDTLDTDAKAALDVLAIAEQIDLDQISQFVDIETLEHLEDEGIVEVVEEGDRTLIALAHPLYGEAVRATMPYLRQRRVRAALADAVQAAGMPRLGDVVRVATWRLDAGQPVDADLLTSAAHRAYKANDFALAERLATAARAAGSGLRAGLVLARSAMKAGRHQEAADLLAKLATEAATDKERATVADSRVAVLGLYIGRPSDAVAVLDETIATVSDADLVDQVRGSVASVLARAPRPLEAIETARPLLERPDSRFFWRAASSASIAMAICGRLEEAMALGRQAHDTHERLGAAVGFLPEAQFVGPILALLGSGRPHEAAELAAKGYDAAVAARDSDFQAVFALHAGRVNVLRGQLATAGRQFREAAVIFREINDIAVLRWTLGGIALAAGMRSARSEGVAALEELAELTSLAPSPRQMLELDLVDRGRAWTAAACGERSEAIAVLRAAAARAADTEQFVAEAFLRHDLVRLGEAHAELSRLVDLSERIDGDLIAALADHARALAVSSGARLEDAANRLAATGALLIAHEAATDAAAAWRAEGHRRRAAACDERARRLASACEGARSPAIRADVGLVALTVREHEVAALAADGLSSREIAEKLYVSHRTVENHLQRIYDKLGVAGRQELAAILER
jgi:DNA-binding CsgD family transcriptional regulator